MTPKDEEWTPKLVRPPENNPVGRTYFDWNDEKLQKWKSDAIKMQEGHARDNNRTEWFSYKPEQRDYIELRILITVYGLRIPQDGTKGAPSCPLKTYTRAEKLHARKIKKMIVKNSGSPEEIHVNVIYISTATKSEDSVEFLSSEEPVFVVKKCRRFVDKDAKAYDNFKDYKENNNLPKGPMLAPQNGSYILEDSDGRVPLEFGETPAASPIKRIRAVTDKIVMVGGIVLAVTGVVTFFAPAAFSAAAMAVIEGGSFVLTGYSLLGACHSIYDKTGRNESIDTEALVLAASIFSAFAGGLNRYWKVEMGKYAREGKTFAEAADKITRFQKNLFVAVNMITFISSSFALLSSFVELWNKKERTWLDYYQFSMALFMTVNVLTKPKTIQDVFESEQLQYLNQIKKNLRSDEAKKGMSSTVEEHSTSDQKAYVIRILNKIENPTEFFELIDKTGSVVTCTADGLAINDKIDIPPEVYNEIGKAVFADKVVQITRYQESAWQKSVENEFGKSVPLDKLEEFKTRLQSVENLSADQRKEAIRDIVRECNGHTGNAFNASWDKAETAFNSDIEKQINKMVNNLQQGSNEAGQRQDFGKLKDLATKEINGTITLEEKQKLQQQIDKCSRHRKQYFFKSSADHRTDENTPSNNEAFKNDITTFTNGQNERLCYRIDVDRVKHDLLNIYNQPNIEDITVNGENIFANMKISEYDRINRVIKEYGQNGKNLMTAATNIANDPAFAGQVETAHDIASITEAINTNMEKLPEPQRNNYLDNLTSGVGSDYDAFRNAFNEKINAVNALDPLIRSQWSRPLSMAYHWWKHENDFGKPSDPPATITKYFGQHPRNLFTTENVTARAHTQSGAIKETYMMSFGKRVHVGFTVGQDKIIASHFTKDDTR